MAAEISTKQTWNGLVAFQDAHAELAVFKAMTPKPLRIFRGPRSNKWIENAAPLIVTDFLREEQADEPSQANVHRFTQYYQLTIVGAGATPEAADDMALDIMDALKQVFKGAGRYFGQNHPTGRVQGSSMLGSGWDLQERTNAMLSVWVRNMSVLVGT